MLAGRLTGDFAQILDLHQLVLSDLADTAGLAFHGGATTDGLDVLVQTVEGAVHAAGRRDGGRLLGTLGWTQGGGDVERALERTQLARLQGQLVQRGGGHAWGGGGIIGGRIGGRIIGGVGGRWLSVDRDLTRG